MYKYLKYYIRGHRTDKESTTKTSLPMLCISILFFIYLLEKTHIVYQSSTLIAIFDALEWPLYILAFMNAVKHSKYTYKEAFLVGGVCSCFLITYIVSGYAELLKGALIIVAMRKTKYKIIVETFIRVLIISFILTIILYITGISNAGVQRRGANSLGYMQANAVGFVLMMLTFLILIYKSNLNLSNRLGLVFLNLVGFIVSDSRSGFLMACLAIVFINNFTFKVFNKVAILQWIIKLLPFACLGITVITACLYPKNAIIQRFDAIFSSRIWLNYYNLTNHNITFLGQHVDLWNMTNKIYNSISDKWTTYMTVGNVYVGMLLQMGLLSTLLVFGAYYCLIKKFSILDEYPSIIVLSLLCIYGLVETSILSVYVCFPFLVLLNRDIEIQKINS